MFDIGHNNNTTLNFKTHFTSIVNYSKQLEGNLYISKFKILQRL